MEDGTAVKGKTCQRIQTSHLLLHNSPSFSSPASASRALQPTLSLTLPCSPPTRHPLPPLAALQRTLDGLMGRGERGRGKRARDRETVRGQVAEGEGRGNCQGTSSCCKDDCDWWGDGRMRGNTRENHVRECAWMNGGAEDLFCNADARMKPGSQLANRNTRHSHELATPMGINHSGLNLLPSLNVY